MKLWRKPFDYLEEAPTACHVYIDEERCKGCSYCVEFCPREVLNMSNKLNPKGYLLPVIDDETKCLACGYCEVVCPEFAIRLSTDKKQ
jgi:2-oxoglutarate ferredoxin oxidoreductase subunit delta